MDLSLQDCVLCPRQCHKNRIAGETGACLVSGTDVYLARAALHYFEEPCISGTRGSGAVFFSGCNLHCIYCQNASIAAMKTGKPVSVQRLSEIFLELQEKGAHNINLVTPSHYALQIREALLLSKEKGLRIPIVMNCSGYESVETLDLLGDLIDIYLTDFKYSDPVLAERYSHAGDYPAVAMAALRKMVELQPNPLFGPDGMMEKGVIVRQLLLPGHVKNSREVVRQVYHAFGDQVYLSLMNQYTPLKKFETYPNLNRTVTNREYNKLIDYALELGVTNAFIQEGETQKESFIPSFDYEGV